MTNQEAVLDILDTNEGTDRHQVAKWTGLSLRASSTALQGLRRKGLVHGGRWHETFVWFLAYEPPE